jgi:hypothetical protein
VKTLIVTLILALAFPAVAQNCPVTIHKVGKMPLNPNVIRWTFENTSDKKIVGLKFDLTLIDAVGDPHGSIFTFADKVKLNPGKKDSGIYEPHLEREEASRGALVTLRKALFEDGTAWEDDGKSGCSLKGTWK